MQLSQKKKTISQIFFWLFENLDWIFNISKKRWSSQLMHVWTNRHQKTWLDKSVRSPVSEDPSTSDMVTGRNTVEILTAAPWPYLLITVQAIQSEKVSVSDMQNLGNVC